jgi:hypothetical protein
MAVLEAYAAATQVRLTTSQHRSREIEIHSAGVSWAELLPCPPALANRLGTLDTEQTSQAG